jgi:predicted RND superfamily exporter protein
MRSLMGSFWLTLLLLFLGIAARLRSWRLGALGMLPNLMPCVWVYGAIAWLDHPITVATAMIAATMLGLVVDNSLHLLHDFRQQRQRLPRLAAATEALRHCGRAIILSSSLLLTGFAMTATSHVAMTVEFSLLAGATILSGILSDVLLLPLLLVGPAAPSQEELHAP